LRSILHIGADKCGSSSIQTFLSRHRSLRTGPARSDLGYACISKNGLKTDVRIDKSLKRSILGYVSSIGTDKLVALSPQGQQSVQEAVAGIESNLIFSCEGWLRALGHPKEFNTLLQVVSPPASNRDVELIAFVRPPVKWINSAWWQWGAWDVGNDFHSWLETAIAGSKWFNYLNHARCFPAVTRLTVEPVYQDVVRQLIEILSIQGIDMLPLPSNQSLPAEVLQLFSQHRQHRPNANSCRSDFLIGHAIAANTSQYSPTPWILSQEQVKHILEATRDSNHQLLGLMDNASRLRVLEDPYWWNDEVYENCRNTQPFLDVEASQLPPYQLASDLFQSLGVAVQILRSKGLLQSYFESLALAQALGPGVEAGGTPRGAGIDP